MPQQVVVYLRWSTDEQTDSSSLVRQTEVCEAFARIQGWTITDRLIDDGYSAFKNEHIEFGKLGNFTGRVLAREVDRGTVLIAEKLDRLSRRPFDEAMAWLFSLTSAGILIGIAETGVVYKPNDIGSYLTTAINFDQANQESAKKADRVRFALNERFKLAQKREGAWTNFCSRPPLWLMRNATADGWDKNDDRIATIQQIFEWSADGLGAQAICKRLNDPVTGTKPFGKWRKYDQKWTCSPVNALLRNPAVEGDFVARTGTFKGQTIHGFYPRIVDADLVARARAGKSARVKTKGQPARNGVSNLWAGMVHCGECGQRAPMTTNPRNGKDYRYFRCEGARTHSGCTNNGYFPLERFEASALDVCLDLAIDDRFFAASGELRIARVRKAELEKEIVDCRARRSRLMRLLEDDDDQMEAEIRELKNQINALSEALVAVEKDIERASGKVGEVEHFRRVNDIREASMSDDRNVREQARARLRNALSAIIHRLEIDRVNGEKFCTLILLGGVAAIRFNEKGEVIGAVQGHLPTVQTEGGAIIEPLLRRLKSSAWGSVARDAWLRLERGAVTTIEDK